MYHGQGILKKEAIGLYYKGTFVNGQYEGKGYLKDESQGVATLKGEFKKGKFHGEG